jgi:acetylornithine deacetylase
VLFGPRGEGAHADTEWVDLTSLDACVAVLARTAARFCR